MNVTPDDWTPATLLEFRINCAERGMCVCWHSGDEDVAVFAMAPQG